MTDIYSEFMKSFHRTDVFLSAKHKELLAEGFAILDVSDFENIDQHGNALCDVDDIVIGFEISKDGRTFNRFFGATTFLFWEEIELNNENEYDAWEMLPETTISSVVEGILIHVDSEQHPDHYKAILDAAKTLAKQGLITYEQLKSAARRYMLSVQDNCAANGLVAPSSLNVASLI